MLLRYPCAQLAVKQLRLGAYTKKAQEKGVGLALSQNPAEVFDTRRLTTTGMLYEVAMDIAAAAAAQSAGCFRSCRDTS